MGLTDALLRAGAGRPHVLVVAALGGTAARLAVEAELARRAWPIATSPADTDILVVAGEPGTELAAVLARIWAQIPAPRARVDVPQPETVPACLDTAKGRLADRVFQGRTALVGSASAGSASIDEGTHGQEQHSTGQDPTASAEPGANGHDHGAAGGGDLAEDDARAAGHNALEHHGGHEHHGGGMELPGGLAMADLGADRDGLMLDRLHVPLGPVLPDWPHGLVLDAVLQGDVVQEARLRVLAPAHPIDASFWGPPGRREPRREVARRLDGLARFLGVAGWPAAASTARGLLDDALAGAPGSGIHKRVEALAARVRRSRTLRRMLRGLRAGDVEISELVSGNLEALHASAAALARNGSAPVPPDGRLPDGSPDQVLQQLAGRLVGAELAAARLIVAAVDPDLDLAAVGSQEPARPDGHPHD